MTEQLEKLIKQAKTARKISVAFLIAAFAIMAGWGYTPLKDILSALFVLQLFGLFSVLAVAFTIWSLYREMQIKALKAKIEDA